MSLRLASTLRLPSLWKLCQVSTFEHVLAFLGLNLRTICYMFQALDLIID